MTSNTNARVKTLMGTFIFVDGSSYDMRLVYVSSYIHMYTVNDFITKPVDQTSIIMAHNYVTDVATPPL